MDSQLREALEALFPVVGLALLGGVVRVVRFGTTSWRQFVGSLAGSAFAGVISHWILSGTDVGPQVGSALIATAGYLGGTLLDALQARLIRLVEEWPGFKGLGE